MQHSLLNSLKSIFGSLCLTIALLSLVSVTSFASPLTNLSLTINSQNNLSTLSKALQEAQVSDILASNGPFTVFAPSNEAFQKLPPQLVENLLKPENKETLSKILKYHVVSGTAKAAKVSTQTTIKSVETSTIKIKQSGSNIILNDSATIITADIMSNNGVVHIIDSVLVPQSVNLSTLTSQNPTSKSQSSSNSSVVTSSSATQLTTEMAKSSSSSSSKSSSMTTVSTTKNTKDSTVRSGGFSFGIFAIIIATLVICIAGIASQKRI